MLLDQEIFNIDKTNWPTGRWSTEPDEKMWKDEATDYFCYIRRHSNFGTLCGYVGIPKSHPMHGDDGAYLDVHGGITYSDHKHHLDAPLNELWWLGFDCAHAYDYPPNGMWHDGEYRDFDFVTGQILSLAKQLKELEDKNQC